MLTRLLLLLALLASGCGGSTGTDDDDATAANDDDAVDDDDAADDDDGTDDDDLIDDDDSGDDDDEAIDDDDTSGLITTGYPAAPAPTPPSDLCTYDSSDWLSVCEWQDFGSAVQTPLQGQFLSWGNGDELFRPTTGPDVEITFAGSAWGLAQVPDLVALGTVRVWMEGSCDGKGGASGSLAIAEPAAGGALLFAAGYNRGLDTAGLSTPPVSVAVGGAGTCSVLLPGDGCWEAYRAIPVALDAGSPTSLLAGETAPAAGLQFRVLTSLEGAGENDCIDGGSPAKSWVLTP